MTLAFTPFAALFIFVALISLTSYGAHPNMSQGSGPIAADLNHPHPSCTAEQLLEAIVKELEESKGHDIRVIDLRGKASFADYMVVVTGTSNRHIKALADRSVEAVRLACGVKPLGVEGEQASEWVLVDFSDVVLHAMTGPVREFYQLEKLWSAEGPLSADALPRPSLYSVKRG